MQCDLKTQPRHFKFEDSLDAMSNTKGQVKIYRSGLTNTQKDGISFVNIISRFVILLGMRGNKLNGSSVVCSYLTKSKAPGNLLDS